MNCGEDRTTLTPDTSLLVDEKLVATPECISCLLYKSRDILNDCRESNPNIGLETCASKKTKEYVFPPFFIFQCCSPYALIGVPFAAVSCNHNVDTF